MATTTALTENSRQGINSKIPPCVGLEARLSRDLRPGCCHAYDETPVGLVVYVRNDPVNLVDPDGRSFLSAMAHFFHAVFSNMGSDEADDTWDPYAYIPTLMGGNVPGGGVDTGGGDNDPVDLSEAAALDKRNQNGLECQPDIIASMSKAWMQSSNGTSGVEAGFTLQGSAAQYTITENAFTNESSKQTIILPNGNFALFHTHPHSGDPQPSGQDMTVANQHNLQMYTITKSGLYQYDPSSKRTIQLTDQLNFLQPCKKKEEE